MIIYRRAEEKDAEDILDFINYVFSHDHRPHDFATDINPAMYGGSYPFWKEHYLAIEDDGHIRATLSVTKEEINETEPVLYAAHVGQVSVHPYHRGKGYMRHLMHWAIDDMRKDGIDFSCLSGLRQRYGYYGYEPGFYRPHYEITTTNIRHVLPEGFRVELAENRFWLNGKMVGELWEKDELRLPRTELLPDCAAATLKGRNAETIEFCARPGDVALMAAMEGICESVRVYTHTKAMIFNFERCMKAALLPMARAGQLEDGEISVRVGAESFGLRIRGKEVDTYPVNDPRITLEPAELQNLLLSLSANNAKGILPRSWCPIVL